MEEKIKAVLDAGETLLWTGSPEKFTALDRSNKRPLITNILVKAIVSAAIIVFFAISTARTTGVNPLLLIALLAAAALIIASPFFSVNKLRSKVTYALTDRRLISCTPEFHAVPLEGIREAVLRSDEDGHRTLLCGPEAVKLEPAKWRKYAVAVPMTENGAGVCTRMVWYALPASKELDTLLKKYLPL